MSDRDPVLTGKRGIVFVFTLTDGSHRRVVFDLLNVAYAEQTYPILCSRAVGAMVKAGHDVATWTHHLID